MARASKKAIAKDFFVNPAAGLGLGLSNKLAATDYTKTRITQDYNLMTTLYRTHWIVRKIIDVVANDMTKIPPRIISDMPPEEIKKIEQCYKKRKVSSSMNEGIRWGRLYGGAGALMLIDGQDDILNEPLDLNTILPNDFKGLLTFDRWSGILPDLSEFVTDLDSVDFGKPKYYRITTEKAETFNVHHSRILRFTGRKLPRWERQVEIEWGASEVEAIIEELMKRDNVSFNIAQLTFLANLRVLKMGDLGESFAINTPQAQQDLYNTLWAQNQMMSNSGVQILSAKDGFETHQYSFGGIAEVMQQFMLDLSGATGIPATKLFGRSPSGMNATGESDLQNYYEMISEQQHYTLEDNTQKLLPVMCMSELGYIPDDLDFDFDCAEETNEDELASIIAKKSDAIIKTYESNLITQKEAREELKQISKDYDVFTNVDDMVTANAKSELEELGLDFTHSIGSNGDLKTDI